MGRKYYEPRIFEARYSGTCPSCGKEINEGDPVCYNNSDELLHVDCYENENPKPKIKYE